jgi:hypothetical protein
MQATPTDARWVGEGEKFTIEGTEYLALRITPTPQAYELEYRAIANESHFVITGDRPTVLGYEKPPAGGIRLLGLTDEELGIDPAQASEVATPPADADQRGEVRAADPRAAKQPDPRERDAAAAKQRDRTEADKQKAQADLERMKMGDQDREAVKQALQEGGGKPQ